MDKLKAKPWNGQAARWAHLKLDGHRVWIHKGVASTYTPTVLDLSFCKDMEDYSPEDDTFFYDCELVVAGKKASYIKTAIKEKDPNLEIYCFSIWQPDMGWDTMNVIEMNQTLFEMNKKWIPAYPMPMTDLPPTYNNHAVEGVVYKSGNRVGWYKWKETKTIDLIVRGTIDGKNSNLGLVGALRCVTTEGYEVARCSGMTQAERAEISYLDVSDKLNGRIVEVSYQYIGEKGRLRHPQFVRFRDDKTADECGLDQDPELEAYWK